MNPVLQRQGPVNPMNKIDIALALDFMNQIDIALVLDWFISTPANRSLPSIEGSDRLADSEMNPVLQRQGLMNPRNSIGTALAMHSHCIGSALSLDCH